MPLLLLEAEASSYDGLGLIWLIFPEGGTTDWDWSPAGREGCCGSQCSANCVPIVCGIVRGNVWYGLNVSVSITMTDKGRYRVRYWKICNSDVLEPQIGQISSPICQLDNTNLSIDWVINTTDLTRFHCDHLIGEELIEIIGANSHSPMACSLVSAVYAICVCIQSQAPPNWKCHRTPMVQQGLLGWGCRHQ